MPLENSFKFVVSKSIIKVPVLGENPALPRVHLGNPTLMLHHWQSFGLRKTVFFGYWRPSAKDHNLNCGFETSITITLVAKSKGQWKQFGFMKRSFKTRETSYYRFLFWVVRCIPVMRVEGLINTPIKLENYIKLESKDVWISNSLNILIKLTQHRILPL